MYTELEKLKWSKFPAKTRIKAKNLLPRDDNISEEQMYPGLQPRRTDQKDFLWPLLTSR